MKPRCDVSELGAVKPMQTKANIVVTLKFGPQLAEEEA
jgi:hypothetical protein